MLHSYLKKKSNNGCNRITNPPLLPVLLDRDLILQDDLILDVALIVPNFSLCIKHRLTFR